MARLQIYLFGAFYATLENKPVAFEYDKVRALLAYLLMQADRPIPREKLAALLWPESSQQAAQNGLRQSLSKLRHALHDHEGETPVLLVQRDSIQFNPNAGAEVDVWSFSQAIQAIASHRHRHLETCSTCLRLQVQACDLYRGNFLDWLSIPDSADYESWATATREHLRHLASTVLGSVTTYYERLGDYERVRSYAARHLDLDPLNETAHLQIIRTLAATGQRTQAIAHFKFFSRLLYDELGLQPSGEMASLAESIRAGSDGFLQRSGPQVTDLTLVGLPVPVTSLVGRVAELAELRAWLDDPDRRLITLAGPGGIGKTRLALAASLAQQPAFSHGVVFVNLAQYSTSGSFVPAVAEALRLPAGQGELSTSEALLLDHLRKKEILLVLDSFEHVLASRPALERLLGQAPGLVVLVTSRVHLNIDGEWVFDLGGLEVPPVSAEDEIERFSAPEFFLQCARRVRPTFNLTAQDRSWVREICYLVQGMPLALMLAAHWIRLLSCEEIAREIRSNLDILATAQGETGERHSSMRLVFDQSWRMLSEEEQSVFRRLSVFRGGFDRQAAHEIAGARLEVLAHLVDQSLLVNIDDGRYDCHDLLRQYAHEKLVAAGEFEQAVNSHLRYFLRLAELKDSQLQNPGDWPSSTVLQAFTWFIREQPNLLAAIQSASPGGTAGDINAFQRLRSLLHESWHQDGVHKLSAHWVMP